MQLSRGDLFQLLGLLLGVATAAGSTVYFLANSRFEARIEALQAQNDQLTARLAEIREPQDEALEESVTDRGPAPIVRSPESASAICGLRANVLTLCGEDAAWVGDYSFALVRVDTANGSPRLFMTVQRRGAAAQMIDAFSGETPLIDGSGGKRIVVRRVSTELPEAVIDVSALRN